MTMYLSRFIALTFLCLAVFGCDGAEQYAQKKISVVNPEVSLGKFKSTDSISTQVTIRNAEDQSYVLEELTLSCGCLTTDFKERKLSPGEDYTFEVNIFSGVLGEGKQYGEIATTPKLAEPLRFEVSYFVEPSTYLFPEHFLIRDASLNDQSWPRVVEFKVEALDNSVELSGPIRLQVADYTLPSGLQYEVEQVERVDPGDSIKLNVSSGTFTGGEFCDYLHLSLPGKDGTMKFAVSVSGNVSSDPISSQVD